MAQKDYEAGGSTASSADASSREPAAPTASRLCNVHVFEAGTPEVERHLAFRDYLKPQPETARAYDGDLKGDLAERFPTNMEAYMNGKDTFIKDTFIIRVEREAPSWSRNRHEAS
jgi:GrpB-like predicted nucleotidyltransferase (UPF0157 family)